jgi:hypothetical protein
LLLVAVGSTLQPANKPNYWQENWHMWKTFAVFALLAGVLEGIGALLSPWLGWQRLDPLYVLIDLCMVFAVLGLYLPEYERLGRIGLVGFCLTLGGFALIAGPEAPLFGVAVYSIGKPIVGLGLLLLAGALWQRHPSQRWVSGLLLGSLLVGAGAMLGLAPSYLTMLSGLLLGAGFCLQGWRQLRGEGKPA